MRTPLACLLLVPAAAAQAATGHHAPAAAPANWHSYHILVQLQDLPWTYSCDDLWYKFRDLLLSVGARAYMTITPFHCGAPGRGEARSPSVELEFQLPQPLKGAATRYAEVSAATRTVRLVPGSPRSLGASDCELVRQLEDTLFDALPVHITSATFSCTPAHAATVAPESFALTLAAAIAAPVARRQAGGVAAGTPRS